MSPKQNKIYFDNFPIHTTYAVVAVIDLSPNKLLDMAVDCAVFDKDPPKIDVAEAFAGDETFAANAPNEADPKSPLPARCYII